MDSTILITSALASWFLPLVGDVEMLLDSSAPFAYVKVKVLLRHKTAEEVD